MECLLVVEALIQGQVEEEVRSGELGERRLQLVFCWSARDETGRWGLGDWLCGKRERKRVVICLRSLLAS